MAACGFEFHSVSPAALPGRNQGFRDFGKEMSMRLCDTPLKLNMEAENGSLE